MSTHREPASRDDDAPRDIDGSTPASPTPNADDNADTTNPNDIEDRVPTWELDQTEIDPSDLDAERFEAELNQVAALKAARSMSPDDQSDGTTQGAQTMNQDDSRTTDTPNASTHDGDDFHGDRATLQELSIQVCNEVRNNRKRQRLVMLVGGALALTSFLGLSRLTGMLRTIDADALAYQGRSEVERHLPDGRRALQGMLESQAPDLVAGGLNGALDMLPQVRRQFVSGINGGLSSINTRFETRATMFMGDVIRQARENIERTRPHAPNQSELIALEAGEEFNRYVNGLVSELHPHYAEEMTRITSWLDGLMNTDPSELNPQQQQQRQLIETMLVLVARASEQQES